MSLKKFNSANIALTSYKALYPLQKASPATLTFQHLIDEVIDYVLKPYIYILNGYSARKQGLAPLRPSL